MYQISPRDFSKLNRSISNEIEKVLLKFVSDGKIKVVPMNQNPLPERRDRAAGRRKLKLMWLPQKYRRSEGDLPKLKVKKISKS